MAIAVVVVLVGLIVPTLSPVRSAARRSATLQQLRSHSQVFATYAQDYDDCFVYFVDRNQLNTTFDFGDGGVLSLPYFWWYNRWNYIVGPAYYSGTYDPSFYPPYTPYNAEASRFGPTPFSYACCFLADPAYWSPSTRLGPAQWRATRHHEVLFPARKVLLANEAPLPTGLDSPPLEVQTALMETAYVDGSAAAVKNTDLDSGYPFGDGPLTEPIHQVDAVRGLHTINGVRGTDRP